MAAGLAGVCGFLPCWAEAVTQKTPEMITNTIRLPVRPILGAMNIGSSCDRATVNMWGLMEWEGGLRGSVALRARRRPLVQGFTSSLVHDAEL